MEMPCETCSQSPRRSNLKFFRVNSRQTAPRTGVRHERNVIGIRGRVLPTRPIACEWNYSALGPKVLFKLVERPINGDAHVGDIVVVRLAIDQRRFKTVVRDDGW